MKQTNMERNEAIGRLRLLYSATNAENKAALECLIPELRESEDERIRKQIEQALIEHDWSVTYKVGKDDCLAWLEKQKEQKLAEWSEKDEKMRLACIDIIEHFPTPSGTVYGPWGDCINWLKSLRSRPKSSEPLELARKELIEKHLTPDPELTGFELRLLDWLSSDTCGKISMDEMKKCVKNRAAELRQELAKEHGKDLPKWKKASAGTKLPSESIISREGDDPRFGSVAVYDCKYITVGELEKLPKEDEK